MRTLIPVDISTSTVNYSLIALYVQLLQHDRHYEEEEEKKKGREEEEEEDLDA